MKLENIFQNLGFGKNVSKIYQVLLDSDKPLLISDIAKSSKISRKEIYRNIEILIKNEFIKVITERKRKYYSANSPKKLESYFKAKISETVSLTKNISKQKDKVSPHYIEYFKGFDGIRAVFDDVINRTPKRDFFYRYTSEKNLDEVNKYLSPYYRSNRDKKKLERLVISNPISGKSKKPRLERFIKFIPQDVSLFNQNIIQITYCDSVAFINLNKEEAFIIRDPNLADFQKVIFKQLYKKL